jgi:hypothetical protein
MTSWTGAAALESTSLIRNAAMAITGMLAVAISSRRGDLRAFC